jgi:hypothetical protein
VGEEAEGEEGTVRLRWREGAREQTYDTGVKELSLDEGWRLLGSVYGFGCIAHYSGGVCF